MNKGQVVGITGTASRDYTAMDLAHMNSLTDGGSWVEIPSGAWIFPSLRLS